MIWYLDRLGSALPGSPSIATVTKAAEAKWVDDIGITLVNTLEITTRQSLLREDSVNITKAVDSVIDKYGASYKVNASEVNLRGTGNVSLLTSPSLPAPRSTGEPILVFTMRFPRLSPGNWSELKEISVILCSMMWGCPAAISKEDTVGSFIKTPANQLYGVDQGEAVGYIPTPIARVVSALSKEDAVSLTEKGSQYQELFEQIMEDKTPLSEMEPNKKTPAENKLLAALSASKDALNSVLAPFIGRPATEATKAQMVSAVNSVTVTPRPGIGVNEYISRPTPPLTDVDALRALYPRQSARSLYPQPAQSLYPTYTRMQAQNATDNAAATAWVAAQLGQTKADPPKDDAPPSATELATLEFESLDREC